MAYTQDQYDAAAAFIRKKVRECPALCVVLGSGLGAFADELEDAVKIPYAEIPGFPRSTADSHAGILLTGRLCGRPLLVMSGRFHYYEGYDMETVCFYIRVLHRLGVSRLLLTNAAGGVNTGFHVGDFMLITDHIKFFSESPARGGKLPEGVSRFFDMTHAYSPQLNRTALQCADALGISLREGVYFYMSGPQFETPAEIRAIRTLGGDAVGMSTVPEVIEAVRCGIEVMGISCITNMAAGMVPDTQVSGEEVTINAAQASERFRTLLREIVGRIG